MGSFRLFRRIKIAPGVTINVSKSGLSTSLGPRGAKVTLGHGRIRKTVGLPGTGVYYTSTEELSSPSPSPSAGSTGAPSTSSGGLSWIWAIGAVVIVAIAVASCLGNQDASPTPSAPPAAALGLIGQPSPTVVRPASTLSAVASAAAPSKKPVATKKPAATKKPTATKKPAPKPTPKPPAAMTVKVTSHTGSVSRNSTASVTIRTSVYRRAIGCGLSIDGWRDAEG